MARASTRSWPDHRLCPPRPSSPQPGGAAKFGGAHSGLVSHRWLRTSKHPLRLRWGACRLMTVNSGVTGAPAQGDGGLGPRYKWIALSNTTLGMLMATINQSIVLIALPDIFRGIGLNPLSPDNTSYLLWMFMGFLVVSAVLVVSFGRLGDMFCRVRMYNRGFAIFTVASIFLTITWMHGSDAALWLILWRVVQGVGGAFLFANSTAILTDAFPANQRGTALGINSIAAIGGSVPRALPGGRR